MKKINFEILITMYKENFEGLPAVLTFLLVSYILMWIFC